jgi:hypothetical protein
LFNDSNPFLLDESLMVASPDDPAIHLPLPNITVRIALSHILTSAPDYSPAYMSDKHVRQAVASLIHNIGLAISLQRRQCYGLLSVNSHPIKTLKEEQEHEFVVEMVPALIYMLSETSSSLDQDDETGFRLLVALLYFLYLSSPMLNELAQVLDGQQVVERRRELPKRVADVCDDLRYLLK